MKIRRRKFGGRLMNTIKTPTDDDGAGGARTASVRLLRQTAWMALVAMLMSAWPIMAQAKIKIKKVNLEPNVYIWNDAGREMQATLINPSNGLQRVTAGATANPARTGERAAIIADATEANLPVFQQSGPRSPLMIPVGGVLVRMIPGVDAASFFAGQGLEYESWSVTRLYFVPTEPGWAALELATRLDDIGAVESAQPNWWRERTNR